jgi:3',5'-cyclic AMP phosphodiesterase CpdA
VSFSLVHLSDPHFGGVADLRQIAAVEEILPDLNPRVTVLSGDLTLRSRHGEFQAARAFVRELERTAPVFVIPGNHDVQWWWRPFVPVGRDAKYRKYRRYIGPDLAPTLRIPTAVVASGLTSHGVGLASIGMTRFGPRVRDIAVKGHLPKREIDRVARVFAGSEPELLRVLVVHHNVTRGALSQRMGLARWRKAQQRILASGADVVCCGHDHQEAVDVLDGRVVVSCAGTLSTRSRGDRPSVFHRITAEEEAIHVEQYRWTADRGLFKRTDVHSFPRPRRPHAAPVEARVG